MTLADLLAILGAVAGVAGAVMGYISLRRTDEFKALDLRLELRRAQSSLLADSQELAPFMEEAKYLYTHLAAARGQNGSGGAKQWLETWARDVERVKALAFEIVGFQTDCSNLTHIELERELVSAHLLLRRVNQIRDLYKVQS